MGKVYEKPGKQRNSVIQNPPNYTIQIEIVIFRILNLI